ncbi:MAG: DUF6496 domain-containing protein [Xanthobacteraceae bacterium]
MAGVFARRDVVGCKATISSEAAMAKRRRKYSPSVSKDVEREMKRFKRGTARSGPGGRAGKVKNRKQAIAIALSEARKEGKQLPKRPAKKRA